MHEYAVVIGAGVAGLASSVALRRAGRRVSVLERAPGPAATGMGFLLMENGLAALERMGLADRARSKGVITTGSMIMRPDGELLERRSFAPHLGMARVDLVDILLESFSGDVTYGCELDRFELSEGGLETHVGSIEADLWVGADGQRSVLREYVAPGHEATRGHIAELISSVQAPDLVSGLGSTMLRVRHPSFGLGAGIVSTSPNTVIWYLTHDVRRGAAGTDAESRRRFAEVVADWPWPLPELLARTDFNESYVWRTADMEPLESLSRGPVVLVGDAAHPLLPFSTQGVNSALVDAVTLADAVATDSPLSDRLARWSRSRQEALRAYLRYGRARAATFLDPIHELADPPFPEDAGRLDLELISLSPEPT